MEYYVKTIPSSLAHCWAVCPFMIQPVRLGWNLADLAGFLWKKNTTEWLAGLADNLKRIGLHSQFRPLGSIEMLGCSIFLALSISCCNYAYLYSSGKQTPLSVNNQSRKSFRSLTYSEFTFKRFFPLWFCALQSFPYQHMFSTKVWSWASTVKKTYVLDALLT
jgi:hypothetical protein